MCADLTNGFKVIARAQAQDGNPLQTGGQRNACTHRLRALHVAVCGLLGSGLTQGAGTEPATSDVAMETVVVREFRGRQMDSARYNRELLETPRLVTILPKDLLEEQDVNSLKDAMRNIPGISLQAGEGNPPAGDQLKIRGYNARDDINVNGARDIGNYFRDPFYVDQIEVVKGPNSVYSGRGSAGGTINFVTRKPHDTDSARIEGSAGTDSIQRLTLDYNKSVNENSAVRVNLLGHRSDTPGRDIAEEERYGFYGAYTWGFTGPTRVTLDYMYLRQNDLPDGGLPADRDYRAGAGIGEVPPRLDFDNFYGHLDDYKDVAANLVGLVVEHGFEYGLVVRNQLRYSTVDNDSVTSSARFSTSAGTANDGSVCGNVFFTTVCARGDTKPRDQQDDGLNNQTDLIFSFGTGVLEHDLVVGSELSSYSYENRRRPDTNGPTTSLFEPLPRRLADYPDRVPAYDGTRYRFETEGLGLYLLDTIAVSDNWDIHAGVRWDTVDAKASEKGRENLRCNANGAFNAAGAFACTNDQIERDDSEVSHSAGVVYKLRENGTLYASFGNAFSLSGNFDRNQVQLAGGANARVASARTFDTPAEETKAFEIGTKWVLGESLDVSAAFFRTETTNGRFPAQASGDLAVLDTDYHIDGFEFLTAGRLTERWLLYSGYTWLDSEVTDSPSRSFAQGQRLGGTPEHSFNVFTTYDFIPRLTLGFGMQHVTKQFSGVQAVEAGTLRVRIPGYTIVDLYSTYRITPEASLRLNVYNTFDKKHISQLAEGGGQAIPGLQRHAVLTLRYDF